MNRDENRALPFATGWEVRQRLLVASREWREKIAHNYKDRFSLDYL